MRTLSKLLLLPLLLSFTSCSARIKDPRTVTARVNGVCGMCERTIEAVAFVKGEAEADWDVEARTARITYDSTRTDADAVLQRVARAGYDNERYRAPDAAYAALPECCRYERATQRKAGGMAQQRTAHADNGMPVTGTKDGPAPAQTGTDPYKAVLDAYFALKNALVASDAAEAKKRAEALDGAMQAVDAEALPKEQRAMWTEVMDAIMPPLAPLREATDLEKQRGLFAKLTAPMARLAKAAPTGTPVYLDHCPMYEGGADWLSREKDIKNPFYGSRMMTCGSVKETITR